MPTTRREFYVKARVAMSHFEGAKHHLEIAEEMRAALLRLKPKSLEEAHITTELISRAALLCGRPFDIGAVLDPNFAGDFDRPDGDTKLCLSGPDFAARVREARLKRGLSGPEFAALPRKTRAAVNAWEKGISRHRTSRLPQVASVLGVSVEDLLIGNVDEG